ncbi:FKBP-type peptidyl-prolyl cis-trans isomerase [Oxalobacter vibrioformis]|uniref:Peptidyl-prolyl cis-trans isomerase n=1 Tax=Oxalobacter vibrioformis TaxID=933080 RepID=A0A9E9LWB1_9BURK|nr:FKBP-type peptidyl-prolyl cis-trans isomerase [Oxalobacter vibrioformis]WAW09872.1 FKBP-type peptidyl-prolyl cis-trans isomerase [Oxalobacter vibrioformis]
MRSGLRLVIATAALAVATAAFAAPEKGAANEVVLPSGVKVETIKEGTGKSPSASDRVTVHYRGTLVNGTEFDSSYSRGQPANFPLRGVIRCWTEGVQKMKVGGKAKLTCPSDTAYGSRGAGSRIPPDSTLIFEIELLGIN